MYAIRSYYANPVNAMNSTIRLCIAGLLAGWLAAAAAAEPPLPVEDKLVHMGVASCANSVCHGAVIPHVDSDIGHNEYTVWSRQDPHSQTYRDLFRDA